MAVRISGFASDVFRWLVRSRCLCCSACVPDFLPQIVSGRLSGLFIRPRYGPQASNSVTCAGMHSDAARISAAMEEAGAVGRAAAALAHGSTPPHVSGRHCPDRCSHCRSCSLACSVRCTSHLASSRQASLLTQTCSPYAGNVENYQTSNVSVGTACPSFALQDNGPIVRLTSDLQSAP